MRKLIILFLFTFLFAGSVQMLARYTANNIYTYQLQQEINNSGDIDEQVLYINWESPSNYYFYLENGIITGNESDDLWLHITNHVPTNT